MFKPDLRIQLDHETTLRAAKTLGHGVAPRRGGTPDGTVGDVGFIGLMGIPISHFHLEENDRNHAFFLSFVWVNRCHKAPMTGIGKQTAYEDGGDWEMVYDCL